MADNGHPPPPPPSSARDFLSQQSPGSADAEVQTPSPGHFPFGTSGTWLDSIPRTEHNKRFLDADFGATSLGPKETWGSALRLYASMLFADSRGAGIFWGPSKVCFYNEKFAPCVGEMHPFLMGRGFQDAFPELCRTLLPVFDQTAATGQTTDVDNILLFFERNGFVEETYFVGQYIPLRGDSGEIEGYYNTVFESTAQKLYERRRPVIDKIMSIRPLATGETLTSFMEALKTNSYDIPAALLYTYDETADDGAPNLHLHGSIAFPANHPSTPLEARLESGTGIVPLFRKARVSGMPLVLSSSDESSADCLKLFEGVEWGGYGEPSREMVITSLAVGDNLLGFFVHAMNPRRPYDDAAINFLVDLKTQMETKWLASISKESTERRQQVLEQRASESERKLRHMAASAPVGMVQVGANSTFEWANDQFYEITGLERSQAHVADFSQVLAETDGTANLTWLEDLFSGSTARTMQELPLARRWNPAVSEDEDAGHASAWMLAMGLPLLRDGKVQHVLGYVIDISHQKWAESIQSRNAMAAKLAKRRQEEFIDVTCHEMRNPLSAITQLADSIVSNIDSSEPWEKIAEDGVAAATTILTCAAHQKRVIDDVLMLSRLDFKMLSINPIIDQPSKIVAATLRMFDGEVAMSATQIRAVRDRSPESTLLDYAVLDPSRLQQILINLISNAIKFVASASTKSVTVSYGASTTCPSTIETPVGKIIWTAPETAPSTTLPELSDGEQPLYIQFVIQDTGPGIPSNQMRKLFKRFSQATSRSHVSYGGSGLGLYISRQLVEKQGGRVGVSSIEGEGTAFAFYLESRMASSPVQTPDSITSDHSRGSAKAKDLFDALNSIPEIGSPAGETSEEDQPMPLRILRRSSTYPGAPKMPGVHILLVEDNLINQRVLAKQLRKQECEVSVANHGEEALQILEEKGCWNGTGFEGTADSAGVDVVLMDVEMPVMNGLQCTKRIRELERERVAGRKVLPIIALTANVRQEHQQTVYDAGMDEFLAKPVTVNEVLTAIREVTKLAKHNAKVKGSTASPEHTSSVSRVVSWAEAESCGVA